MNTYTPSEFIDKMAENELPQPVNTTMVGLAKYDREKPQSLQFSYSSCQQWFMVPMDMIESITHLTSIRCQDHQHPLVKLNFKCPDKSRSELNFFFGVISQLQGMIQHIARASTSGTRAVTHGGDCYTLIVEGQVYVCCGDPPLCTGVAVAQV